MAEDSEEGVNMYHQMEINSEDFGTWNSASGKLSRKVINAGASSNVSSSQHQSQVEGLTKRRRKLFANELLELEEQNTPIFTFNQGLDGLLGGGIFPGTMTEVVGPIGLGKTTFCFQLSLNAQIPRSLNGVDGDTIYIDTEHSLNATRIKEMTSNFVEHCNEVMQKNLKQNSQHRVPNELLSEEKVMSRIHVHRECSEIEDLVRVILSLESFLQCNNNVKLIVIDSIAFLMYTEKQTFASQTKVLYGVGQALFKIVNKFSVAVVITNNMTTKFANDENMNSLIPYLGDSWQSVPNQRLVFSWAPGNVARNAELISSSFRPSGSISYRITSAGFRN